jgi:hypothetical protein
MQKKAACGLLFCARDLPVGACGAVIRLAREPIYPSPQLHQAL